MNVVREDAQAIELQGVRHMTSTDASTTAQAAVVAAPGAQVAAEKAVSNKTASPKKGAPKGQKSAKGAKPKAAAATPAKATRVKAPKAGKPTAGGFRESSKTAMVVAMLQRKGGATLEEITDKMSWQKHTVRGLISTLGSKHGLRIESTRREDGVRVYTIAAGGTK
jgi:Protein of unknown function (DUF3489)